MDKEILVNNIRNTCKKRGIQISQLEKDLNFGSGLISRWVKTEPALSKVVDVALYLHVSVDSLIEYQRLEDNKFLSQLISATEDHTVVWHAYSDEVDFEPKEYTMDDIIGTEDMDMMQYQEFLDKHREISYYAKIESGYISIYGCYEYHNVVDPSEIQIFIQPTLDAELVRQNYTTEQLKPLWLKVLCTLGKEAPDAIKAEEIKNNFMINYEERLKYNSPQVSDDDILNDPENKRIIARIDSDEFKQLQKILEDSRIRESLQKGPEILSDFQRILAYYHAIKKIASNKNSKAED